MVTLRDLYIVELSDLLDAERQMLRELPLMAARATSLELRAVFDDHYRDTHRHIERLQSIFDLIDERARASTCHGVRGLVEEARDRFGSWERGDVLDAALAGAARRFEHYEIAAYASAAAYVLDAGLDAAAALLRETLDEERRADQRIARLSRRPADVDAEETLMLTRGEPEWRSTRATHERNVSGGQADERT